MENANNRKRRNEDEPCVFVVENSQELQESLECNICRSWLIPPIRECVRGHTICSKCWGRMQGSGTNQTCAECRHGDGYQTECRSMDKIVKLLLIDCKYSCGERFSVPELSAHHEVCKARPIFCPYGCKIEVAWSKIEDHLKLTHRMKEIGALGSFQQTRCLTQGRTEKLIWRTIYRLQCGEDVFFAVHQVHEFGICIYVQSKDEYSTPVSAKITVMGVHEICEARFTTVVGTVRQRITGPNILIITSETILGWSAGASPQEWNVIIQISMPIGQQ